VHELISENSTRIPLESVPQGAQVYARDFFDGDNDWELLGRTALHEVRVPLGGFVWRLIAPRYETKDMVFPTFRRVVRIVLDSAQTVAPYMVHLPGGQFELFTIHSVALDPYWIDKHEVTNAQFKLFVDSGGYVHSKHWVWNGAPSERLRSTFIDRTGRAGPSTWEVGNYAAAQAQYPVTGVSWYEANAYCLFVCRPAADRQ
jgi:eukaryotic-like serine/threonine-protein kinase